MPPARGTRPRRLIEPEDVIDLLAAGRSLANLAQESLNTCVDVRCQQDPHDESCPGCGRHQLALERWNRCGDRLRTWLSRGGIES